MMKWDLLCPICGEGSMNSNGYCAACEANLTGVNAELVRASRRRLELDGEVVWENECRLELIDRNDGLEEGGTMVVTYLEQRAEFRVYLSSVDYKKKHEIFSKLEGVPVRITVFRVPGGNA